MNVIDVLAICPYWISLFFLDESPSVEAVTDATNFLQEEEAEEAANEGEGAFGSVSRIMQVHNNTYLTNEKYSSFSGISNCSCYENLQACPKISWFAVYGSYGQNKLERYWPSIFFGIVTLHHIVLTLSINPRC